MSEPQQDVPRDEPSPQLERQLAELSLLYNLGKSFSAVLDLSELLTRVVEAAVALTRAEEGVILLPDPETGELVVQASRNADDQLVDGQRPSGGDSLAGQVMQTGEPILMSAHAHGGWEQAQLEYLTRSLLYVPLIAKGRVIGVLGVNNGKTAVDFTAHDQTMLTALGGYAAIAIENARLFEETLHRTRELTVLLETANAISFSLDLGRVLKAVSRQMMRGLEAHWCIISSWDETTDHIYKLAECREAIWGEVDGPRYLLTEYSHLRYLLESGEPLNWCLQDPSYEVAERERLIARDVGRVLAVPLQVSGNILGLAEVLSTMGDKPFPHIAQSRAMRAALEIAPLITRNSSLAREQSRLLRAARTLTDAADADWCALYIWDRETDSIQQILESGVGVWPDGIGDEVELIEDSRLRVVLHEQRIDAVHADDPRLNPAEQAMFDRVGAGAMLALPLVFQSKTVGLIRLFDLSSTRAFSSGEINLARAIATQAAVALENARLYRDLERSLVDLQSAQSQLIRAARLSALGELAAAVAHQVNNPLTTILGDAEILAQDLPSDHPNYESAQAILRAGRRARAVVARLLNMARRDDARTWLDVNQTIEETLVLIGSQIARRAITLEVVLAKGLPPVDGVQGQLEDVWLNLLINARDAIPPNREGRIMIRSQPSPDGSYVQVLVEDNGIGISPEHQAHLFARFFTTKPRGKGTGLGLYICHQIITQHDGQIAVESQPGEGTRVIVSLPVAT